MKVNNFKPLPSVSLVRSILLLITPLKFYKALQRNLSPKWRKMKMLYHFIKIFHVHLPSYFLFWILPKAKRRSAHLLQTKKVALTGISGTKYVEEENTKHHCASNPLLARKTIQWNEVSTSMQFWCQLSLSSLLRAFHLRIAYKVMKNTKNTIIL